MCFAVPTGTGAAADEGRRAKRGVAILAVAASLAGAPPTSAQSLRDAFVEALRTNPGLAAAWTNSVAASENIVQVRAGGRPRAGLTTTETEFVKQAESNPFLPDRTLRSGVTVNVPLYRSGVVRFGVKEAEERYGAVRENFRVTVANLLAAVVGVYCDVVRDEAIVRASERNVTALQTNLRGIQGRYSIGDMTSTDVALSAARLALARGSLEAARAQLINSRENFVRVVGMPPVALADPAAWPDLPPVVDGAVREALANNGGLRAARRNIDAADYRLRSLAGQRGMQLSAFGSGNYFNNLDSVSGRSIFRPRDRGTSAQIGIAIELPLYQGGFPASRLRQANAERSGAIEQVIATEREIVAQTRSFFATWRLSLDYLRNAQAAIAENEKALKGARTENNIGTRTLLDVLDTERELFNNQVTVASVQRDVNVAAFNLLAVMGKADPADLGLAAVVRDRGIVPLAPRGSFSDWADDPRSPASTSTGTATVAPQDGGVRP